MAALRQLTLYFVPVLGSAFDAGKCCSIFTQYLGKDLYYALATMNATEFIFSFICPSIQTQLGNDNKMGYDEYLVALELFWTATCVDPFRPWLHPLEGRERVMTPWIEGDAPFAVEMLGAFKDICLELSRLHRSKMEGVFLGRPLGTPCLYAPAPIKEVAPLNFVWNLYCTVLSLPGTPLHILGGSEMEIL